MTYQRIETALVHEIDGELAILEPASGMYFGLESTGRFIWELLNDPIGLEAIVERVVTEYGIEPEICRKDIEDFLRHLKSAGLLAD